MYGFEGVGFVGILWYLRRLSNIHINHNLYMVIKKKVVPSFWIRITFFIFIFRSNKQLCFWAPLKKYILDFSGHKTKTPKT
jgi:hypothetical protein